MSKHNNVTRNKQKKARETRAWRTAGSALRDLKYAENLSLFAHGLGKYAHNGSQLYYDCAVRTAEQKHKEYVFEKKRAYEKTLLFWKQRGWEIPACLME